jgi:4-diphosphocytidyl-2-C-methyl-D-erythritol kinase
LKEGLQSGDRLVLDSASATRKNAPDFIPQSAALQVDKSMVKTVLAPAKINIALHVCRKRSDGYHDLAMIMQKVSLFDRLQLSLTEEPGVEVCCAAVPLSAGQENIAARAARVLLARSERRCGVRIVIDKVIPVAAGLGGGSSDAAAVLHGLNEMLALDLSPAQLREEGVKLGADVPFFLFPGTAWATGIGERLQVFGSLPPVWYVLVNPGFAVSTAWVFQNLQLTSGGGEIKLPKFPKTVEELAGLLHNDLEAVTAGRFPEIGQIKERLLYLGAAGALMSGSGPTVFGVFSREAEAREAAATLAEDRAMRVFLAQPVD